MKNIEKLIEKLEKDLLNSKVKNEDLLCTLQKMEKFSNRVVAASGCQGSSGWQEGVWSPRLKKYVRNNSEIVRAEGIPVKLLPNSSGFSQILGPQDWLFGLFGISSRSGSSTSLTLAGPNGRANGFVITLFREMEKARIKGNRREFWRQAKVLMNSRAYQLMAYHYVCPGWYRKKKLERVEKELQKISELVRLEETEIDFRRFYIPKSSGKMRPIGSPTIPWRAYLHMWNNILVWARKGKEREQHAYFPQRGIHTAWRTLMDRIEKGVTEIHGKDLRSFFDKVNLKYNKEMLKEDLEMPEDLADFFYRLNQSIPKLGEDPSQDLLEEPVRKIIFKSSGELNPENPLLKGKTKEDPEVKEIIRTTPEDLHYKQEGVPQGAATSCGLATLNLKHLWTKVGSEVVAYADDMIVLGEDFDPSCKEAGVENSVEKEEKIMEGGNWLKPMKFLGLKYIPPYMTGDGGVSERGSPQLEASTRKGSTMPMDYTLQVLHQLLQARDKLDPEDLAKQLGPTDRAKPQEISAVKKARLDPLDLAAALAPSELAKVLDPRDLASKLDPSDLAPAVGGITTWEWVKKEMRSPEFRPSATSLFKDEVWGPKFISALFNKGWDVVDGERSLENSKGSWYRERFTETVIEYLSENWVAIREGLSWLDEVKSQLEEKELDLTEWGSLEGVDPDDITDLLIAVIGFEDEEEDAKLWDSYDASSKLLANRLLEGVCNTQTLSTLACHHILKGNEYEGRDLTKVKRIRMSLRGYRPSGRVRALTQETNTHGSCAEGSSKGK